MHYREIIDINVKGKTLVDITQEVASVVAKSTKASFCQIFLPHTSASLLIQENADPTVLLDLVDFYESLVPESRHYRHSAEGPDDMPAHIKASLNSTSLLIPTKEGKMLLGTWQGLYIFEHRQAVRQRRLIISCL